MLEREFLLSVEPWVSAVSLLAIPLGAVLLVIALVLLWRDRRRRPW